MCSVVVTDMTNMMMNFGEMTLYHYSGTVPFEPEIWDTTMGEWLKLPR